jgi:hypothetical protein
MKIQTIVVSLSVLVLIEALAIRPVIAATSQDQDGKTSSVLVELFTSEGCSSCPPADRILSELQERQPIPGVHVITLSEHVDYWNYLGWSDPYSSEFYSQRQRQYALQFRNSTTYTPQMIVDGRAEFVGSKYNQAISSIKAAAALPKAHISLDARTSQGKVDFKGEARLPDDFKTQDVSLYGALVEDKLRSAVKRGENSGRTLEHSSVVRELVNLGEIRDSKPIQFEKSINEVPTWKPENLRVIVFAQDKTNLAILGAAESRVVELAP